MRSYQHHIRVYVDEELSNEVLQVIYKTVELIVPEGILRTINQPGKANTDVFYHIRDGRHAYDMPTTRDLTPDETELLFDALDYVMTIDFDVESTTPVIGNFTDSERDAMEMGLDAYKQALEDK